MARGTYQSLIWPVDNIYLPCYTAICLSSIAGAGYSSPFPSHQRVHTRWFGRALEWHSRGQRFDPAYLHHEKRHPIGCLFFILKVAGFWQVRRILFLHFLSAQSCLWDWQSDSMKAQRKNGAGKGETICGFLHSYILSSACCVRAIWSLLLRSTIAINADGWRRASAMGSCLQTTNGGGAST